MTFWALTAVLYGALLAVAALTQPIRRRAVALAASLAFALSALATGTLPQSFWVTLLVPGALLLTGYWLSGLFFRSPQAWLERWLLRVDASVSAQRWMAALPRVAREALELSYASVYLLVGGGAIYVALSNTAALEHYWNLVLASELASFAPLPWLRSRPPRAVEGESVARRASATMPRAQDERPGLRRLNAAILDNASIQANTLPSGHVSGGLAAALGVMAVDPAVGATLVALAMLIAIAAIAGRYHYVVDCVAGAAVALFFWAML